MDPETGNSGAYSSLTVLGKEPKGKCHSSKQSPAQGWQFNWRFSRLQPVFSAGAATRLLALQALRSASPVNGVLSVPHGSSSFVAPFSLSCHLTRRAEPSPPGFHIVLIFPETADDDALGYKTTGQKECFACFKACMGGNGAF